MALNGLLTTHPIRSIMADYEQRKLIEDKFRDFYLTLKEHDIGKAELMADFWVSLKMDR